MKYILGIFFACALALTAPLSIASDQSEQLVLTQTSLGPLQLAKNAKVSVSLLKILFPSLLVKYEIGQGDSPDFHYFEVQDKKGTVLFSIKSFIDETTAVKRTSTNVPMHLLRIASPTIRDEYGLHVGDNVKDVIAKRGESLSVSAMHHDIALGSKDIYYSIETSGESPESFTLKDAVEGNWKVRFITWPEPAWE